MDHVQFSVECGGFAEEEEDGALAETFGDVFRGFEEDQLHLSAGVSDNHAEPLSVPLSGQFEGCHFAQDLDIGSGGPDVGNLLDAAPVDVPERKEVQEVSDGRDLQFASQQ